jgi:osmotically-inducible protein OsmY
MSKTSLISEMFKFRCGGKVVFADGEEGRLEDFIFEPGARRLTHIGVKQGRLFGKITHFPLSAVTGASGVGVFLSAKRAEGSTLAKGDRLDAKTSVENSVSTARGTLLLVAVHPENGELAYLVARRLHVGRDVLIAQEFVESLSSGRATIAVPEATLKDLPPYRPDGELQSEVEGRLYDFTPLHVDLQGIRARVLDSVLYLDGNISSSLRSDIVTDQASSVPGLMEIKNTLIGDDNLAADLAMALGRDPRTRDLPIGVYPRLGVVRLGGAVHTSQQKSAASEIARSFPAVRSVDNTLAVDPSVDLLNVMASAEGAEAEDLVPGKYVRHTK